MIRAQASGHDDISRQRLDDALGIRVSDEQWDVISAPLEPAVVVAGAGSGKTTAMAARVAWLVGSGRADAGSVLGLTFTTKAAASLLGSVRRSVRALVGATSAEEAAREPVVQTYNAFAARILTQHGVRLGREPEAMILVDGARQQLAYRVVCTSDLPLDRFGSSPVALTSALLELDDQCSELDVDLDALMDFDDDLQVRLGAFEPLQSAALRIRDTSQQRQVLAQLVRQWRSEKQRRDVLDFTDQTRLALELVRAYPDVAASIREQSSVVLLDEYQDTSLAQRKLLQVLFGDGHPVTAVGDPCQAIYGWRGASVDNIESFPHHFPVVSGDQRRPAARYPLSANRRSGPAILAVANDLSHPLRQLHDGVQVLRAGSPERGTGQVECGLFATADEERAWVVDRVRQLGAAQQSWGTIAILAATGRELADVDAALREQGVPTQLHGAAGLLRQPIVVEVRSVLQVLHDPVANPALIRLLSGPRWRIGVRDLAALGARAVALAGGGHRAVTADVADALDEAVAGADPVEAVSLSDAVLDLGDENGYSTEAVERLNAFASELRMLRRHAGEPVLELILRIVRVTGMDVTTALHGSDQQVALAAFCDLAAEFGQAEGRSSLGSFLVRLADAERFDVDLSVDQLREPNAVQLMTIHKAKGLEFPHVFVPAVAKGAFPGGAGRSEWLTSPACVPWPIRSDAAEPLRAFPDPDEGPRDKHVRAYRDLLRTLREADDQRLAYVAVTRAEATLVITGHWWGPTQAKPRGPEPYLRIVRDACLAGAGRVVHWEPEPVDAVNPSPLAGRASAPWPAVEAAEPLLRQSANAVRTAMAAHPVLPQMPIAVSGLSERERSVVADWELDARLLLDQARQSRAATVPVRLPGSISASTAIRAVRDPDGLAADLLRPMPAPPSARARRGTAFHAWVEARYGQQSLLDPDDLPGAADEGIVSDEALADLKRAFERSAFAARTPVAVEQPFAIVLGGRVIRGRIDAVFEANGRYDVIDWKTGSSGMAGSIDPAQLAVYALAWSQIRRVPLSQIDAGFYLVATDEVIRPADWQALLDAVRPDEWSG